MIKQLKECDLSLLERIFENQKITDTTLLSKLKTHNKLVSEEVEKIVDIVSDEFMQYGLEENSEPNEYGKEVDDLLGKINMLSPRHYAESE